jgi:hypothetical protein
VENEPTDGDGDADPIALDGRFSNPSLLQFWMSFSASAKIFLSTSKSNWKLLRGISPTCGDN